MGEQRLDETLEQHRGELTGHCYRMLGSAFEADDAVQETLVRAWKAHDRFEGRSALRSWLYRIATNVCLDMLQGRQRRARPVDLAPAGTCAGPLGAPLPESAWVQPIPDERVLSPEADPAEAVVSRESIRLAFIAALQFLPPRQRAVLILREVLRWKAAEVAELLDTSVPSVNSALQRARATLAEHGAEAAGTSGRRPDMDDEHRELLAKYVDIFERYDIAALVTLLRDDAAMTMPPFELWLRGHEDIAGWMLGTGEKCRGSVLVPTAANGAPAFGHYHPADDGGHDPWALQILDIEDGAITGLHFYLDTPELFPLFGLPPRLEPGSRS
ncbi:sigma-70 family RNA polymerase sigma factor [Nocardiopsis potens]|uniref:sigma-70 family RNA polymerase sigma factor n=1 Tax=Nocardiopsis potens TaxID=1246458 RepID=UPI000344C29A|nr:sigma-70 family RNA polymerase sigma factor [Nocardiopsis potens]